MSLLIKALDKAQEAKVKQEQAKKRVKTLKTESITESADELTLSPPDAQLLETPNEAVSASHSILESAATVANKETSVRAPEVFSAKPVSSSKSQASSATQTQAANVFSSKRIEATHQNTKLAIIAGSGLIALLAVGVYYYQFVDSTPVAPMPSVRPPHVVLAPTPEPTPAQPQVIAEAPPQNPPTKSEVEPVPDAPQAFTPHEPAGEPASKPTKIAQKRKAPIVDVDAADAESTLDTNEVVVAPSKKSAKSNMVKVDKAIASESASIQVSQSKPQDAVNPLVMRAYEAYNAGKDGEAQKLYKQALQRDGLNVDALLGLGAIATRQGRTADAGGWYRKVLELDPKNSTALTVMADMQQQQDPQTAESRIKSMLAKSPNNAGLYAALGNLYADQNQWPSAQQAYFDAFRLNESASNAFNLAVSLDQMGKPKLALPYYQQALQTAQQYGASGIDKAALEARIAAIQ